MRRLFSLCSLVLALVGCEVRTLYGVELLDFQDDERWKEVQGSDYTLYLSSTFSPEEPGVYLVALANDRPTEPSWDWEEFQSRSPDVKTSAFGRYYDQTYRDMRVSSDSTCAIRVERFDHRDSAQEVEYGLWLHGQPNRDALEMHPKGVLVGLRVTDCNLRLSGSADYVEELTVVVENGRGQDEYPIKISLRVNVEDKRVQWSF